MHPGFYVPIVIPMSTTGSIDYASLDKHLCRLLANGARGIMLHRHLSELDTLYDHELSLLCRYIQAFCAERCPVIIDIGADSLADTQKRLAYAIKHSISHIYLPIYPHMGETDYAPYVIVETISQQYRGKILLGIDQDHSPLDFPILRKITALPNVVALATNIQDQHMAWYLTRKLPGLSYLVHNNPHSVGGRIPHCQPIICNPLANIIPASIEKVCRFMQANNPQAATHILKPYKKLIGQVDDSVDTYLLKTILHQQGVISKRVGCRTTPMTPWIQRHIVKQLSTISTTKLLESTYA